MSNLPTDDNTNTTNTNNNNNNNNNNDIVRNHSSFINFNNTPDNNNNLSTTTTPRQQQLQLQLQQPIFDPNPIGSSKRSPTTPRVVTYRECLKNHAATMGGTVTDGCGEFMPSGEDGTIEALKCAACNCHRNFHRRETTFPQQYQHHHNFPTPQMRIAFGSSAGGSVGTESSSEELNFGVSYNNNNNNNIGASAGAGVGMGGVAPPPPPLHLSAKKRFRTKFTTEQKEKMMAFAEKLGWRIPREDDSEMQRFCGEVGVKRQVFKVWMHNNKSGSSSGSGKKNGGDQEFN